MGQWPSLLCHRGMSGRWCSRQSRHLHPSSRKEQIMAAEKPVAPRGASKRSNTIGQDAGTRPRNAAQSAPEATKKVKSIDPAVLKAARSEEHTPEFQSLMRISYVVFCWKKKTYNTKNH